MTLIVLALNVSAITGTFNNYSNPYQITLPSTGYGGNKVGLYIDSCVYDYGGDQNSQYRWIQLSGSTDVISACNSLRFDVTNKIIVMTQTNPAMRTRTAQFYGSNMTTSTYKTIPINTVSTDSITTGASYSHKTIIRNPVNQAIVVSDTRTYDLP